MSATAENDQFSVHVAQRNPPPPTCNPTRYNYPDNGGGQVHQSYRWETKDMGEPVVAWQAKKL